MSPSRICGKTLDDDGNVERSPWLIHTFTYRDVVVAWSPCQPPTLSYDDTDEEKGQYQKTKAKGQH